MTHPLQALSRLKTFPSVSRFTLTSMKSFTKWNVNNWSSCCRVEVNTKSRLLSRFVFAMKVWVKQVFFLVVSLRFLCAFSARVRRLRHQLADVPRQPDSPLDTCVPHNQSSIGTIRNRHTPHHHTQHNEVRRKTPSLPVPELGNLRACCLPLQWQPKLGRILETRRRKRSKCCGDRVSVLCLSMENYVSRELHKQHAHTIS